MNGDALAPVRARLRWSRPENLVLATGLVAVVALWGFGTLAAIIVRGDSPAFDEWVLRSLRSADDASIPIGPRWLVIAVGDLTALGSATVLNVMILSVAGFLALRGHRDMVWLVVLSTYGGMLASLFLKGWFERPRPSIVPHLMAVSSSSFPSGHSMLSALTYLTLGALLARAVAERSLKIYCLAIATVLTLAIGLTRVYAGVHYPSDVLAGWAAGLLWALLCTHVARVLQRRGVVRRAD